jgi:F-type H+-transporting ATPase subunit alpha
MRSEHADALSEIRETKAFEDGTRDKVVKALEAFGKQFA